ncbi:MAG: hypothetical protein H0T42_19900 [Deltaproteobacteria bacterium]|nr:hypothetical protein [Deltaproteobacteria bacterium]
MSNVATPRMKSIHSLLLGVAIAGCGATDAAPSASGPIDKKIASLAPTPLGPAAKLDKAIASHFAGSTAKRTYIQTDKPLYQPGETVWFRADVRLARTMVGGPPMGVTVQLVSPRGAIIATKRVLAQNGVARNDFALADEIEGGEYTIQLSPDSGGTDTKKIIVNTYEAPRLMKTLELLRKAYGEGDQVTAAVEIKRTTGEVFADRPATGVVTIDDVEVARLPLKTDKDGKALAKFQLPAKIARGDGFLTILVEDGGITESIQRRIPIVMKTLQLSVFPEGGDLVEGLPGRVYFMAKTTIGKPADIEGTVVDDRGTLVTELRSIHDGMGRFELTPQAGRTYRLEITKPVNIVTQVAVPAAKPDGCVLRSVDQRGADVVRIAALCKTKRSVQIEATLRDNRLAGGSFEVDPNTPAVVELPIASRAQGAVRVTLFSAKNEPLAERLVYHKGASLKVTVTPDKKAYAPRDAVKLRIRTVDARNRPVKASLGLAVVDDTVLSYADDKSAKIMARMYLEPELGATAADPIEEPNYYFSDKPDATAAMDALLATRGYRRFEWQHIVATEGSR